MNNFLKSFLNAAGTFTYVAGIVTLLSNAQTLFGGSEDTPLIPLFMLMLFVISALVTGLLVLGKPILLYVNGQKKEGIAYLTSTLFWLICFLAATGFALLTLT